MAQESILVIEDDQAIATLIKINLEFENYKPIMADDGEAGLIKAGSEKPDLVLLDIMLPKMDGFEVLRNLKKTKETAVIPVIMLTALGHEESVKKGYDLGAVDYISKPFSINRLLSAVETHVRKPRRDTADSEHGAERQITIAIIGAGETGTYLLNVLQADPHFHITGVSDLNMNVEGIRLAQKLSIPVYDEITFFTRSTHPDCIFVTDDLHYDTIHQRILNINSQEMVGPVGLGVFLHVIRHLEDREKVTRAVLREYKQVIE